MLFGSRSRLLYNLLAGNYLILQVLGEIAAKCMNLIYSLGALWVERVLDVVEQGKTLLLLGLAGTWVVRLLILVDLNGC